MMKIFTESDNLNSTVLWKYGLMIFVIAVLTTSVGWAKSSQLETLGVEEIEDPRPFITIWKTDNPGSSDDDQITIPTDPSGDLALVYNYDIYWEDVNNSSINGTATGLTNNHTIDFPTPGTYSVEITGEFPKIFFNNTGDKSKILAVEQWGDIVWMDMGFSFRGCDHIAINASDAPDLSNVTNMNGMFRGSSINQSINHWDVSNVTDMSHLFRQCTAFNKPLDHWNVSNVIYVNHMFYDAINFNQEIGAWDLASVTAMRSMFYNAESFNQHLGDWNVSNVDNMQYMFHRAINFNKDIGGWNVQNVTNLNSMFYGATHFDQDLNNWDVSNVTDMALMFGLATNFKHPLGGWDVSSVAIMDHMLNNTAISPVDFELTLQGWLGKGVNDDITLGVKDLRYCNETDAMHELINNRGWNLVGIIQDCNQTINFSDLEDKVYGDDVFDLVGTVSSGYPPQYISSDEEVAIISGETVTITGAGTTIITAFHPGVGNYNAAPLVIRELKVNKAYQKIIFEPIAPKVLGDESFDLMATTDSGLEMTFTSSDESVAIVEGNTVTIIGPGTVVITAIQEGNANYHAADPVEQILQVNKKSQSIVFETMPSMTILDDDFDLTAVASSGLDVIYTSSDEAVATVLNGRVSIVGIGETMITASQPGNVEYEAAADVQIKLSITKVPQEITFEPIMDKLADDPDFEIVASSSSGLPIALAVSGPATIEGNSISLKGTSGMVAVTATQGGDDIYSPAEPVIRTFEVSAAPITGVIDLQKEGVSIYPNPVHEWLNIELSKTHQAVMYVSDGGGNVVLEQKLETNLTQVDFSSLSNGLYFIKIQLEDKVLYDKVIKK